jgi:hypothetical protein
MAVRSTPATGNPARQNEPNSGSPAAGPAGRLHIDEQLMSELHHACRSAKMVIAAQMLGKRRGR